MWIVRVYVPGLRNELRELHEDDDKVTESSMQKFPAYVLHASMTALSQH
jgi:hypothetical protein